MRFANAIVFVADIRAATALCRDVLRLAVEAAHGSIVIFEGHFAIHHAAELRRPRR